MFGAQTWSVTEKEEEKKLQTHQRKMEWRILTYGERRMLKYGTELKRRTKWQLKWEDHLAE
jgi:hypothetical protein